MRPRSSRRAPGHARLLGITGALVLLLVVGCNAISGAGDLSVDNQSQANIAESRDPSEPEPSGATKKNDGGSGNGNGGGSAGDADAYGTTANDASAPDAPQTTGGGSGVECGNSMCGGPNATCCLNDQGATRKCTNDPNAACEVAVVCGGRANCGGGEVCCLTINTNGSAGDTKCAAESACKGTRNLIFCRTDADCPTGELCVATAGAFREHGICH